MNEQLIPLIVIAPLLTALITPFLAYLSAKLVRAFSILSVLISLIGAISVLLTVIENGPLSYFFGSWPPPIGIEYYIDPLGGTMAVLIAAVSFLVAIYSGPFYKNEKWYREGGCYGLHLLITAGLLGMSVTGDIFNLYVFFEISSLATYGLISTGGPKALVASFKYLILGTIGTSFYLLGVGYLYSITGTLNMLDLAEKLQPLIDSPAIIIAMTLMAVGLTLKMAQFPLHGWLPDAHTYAPPPLSALMSGIVIKVPAYILLRVYFFIIGPANGPIPQILTILGWLAALGIIFGSVMAIAQSELKRMLAYSSVAQISYVVLGLAIGNSLSLIGAILHMINHAVMKSCLFFVAGAYIFKTGEHSIDKLRGIYKKMPLSMGAFVIAALSMIGIPPMAGFFSKWYLVFGAIEANLWPYVVVIILSSLLNLVYFLRVIEIIYLKGIDDSNSDLDIIKPKKGFELPLTLLIPILVLSLGIIVIGLSNEQIVTQVLQFAIPGGGY